MAAAPVRRKDWVSRLLAVVDDAQGRPFEWGQHDCCLFAARCIDAVTGSFWAGSLDACYQDEATALAYIKAEGGIRASVSRRFGDPVPPLLARRGDLVLVDSPLGEAVTVCVGPSLVGAAPSGLTVLPLSAGLCAWRID